MLEGIAQHAAKIPAEEIARLVGRPDPLVLEIGCHDGSDTVAMLAAMPDGTFHCFEPDVRPRNRFWKRLGGNRQVTLYHCAITDTDESQPFYASTGKVNECRDWDYSGSLRVPTVHLTRSPEVDFRPPEPVECRRLDSWLHELAEWEEGIRVIDFAWIDVQGGQRGLIAGGRLALALTRWLYIEVHQEPLYDGEPTQDELVALLPGFEPVALYEQENILFRNRHCL